MATMVDHLPTPRHGVIHEHADYASIDTIQLTECFNCKYSLEGLPADHRCPECGFAYDAQTFVLTCIPRGAGGMSTNRRLGWFAVAAVAMFGPSCAPICIPLGRGAGLAVVLLGFVVWLGMVIYLIASGRHERRGMSRYLFTAGGFGQCAGVDAASGGALALTPWHTCVGVQLERKSPRWQRLRVNQVGAVAFDGLVRCDEALAPQILDVLNARIADNATGDDAPPP